MTADRAEVENSCDDWKYRLGGLWSDFRRQRVHTDRLADPQKVMLNIVMVSLPLDGREARSRSREHFLIEMGDDLINLIDDT